MLVSEFIAKHKLLFTATLEGFNEQEAWYSDEKKKKIEKPWMHDRWEVKFTKENWMPAGALVSAYRTGTGHRVKAGSALRHEEPGQVVHANKRWFFINQGFRWTPKEPVAWEVLHCLAADARAVEETFEEWCSNCGSDTDSIRARATYDACRDTATKLIRLVGLEGLAELLSCELIREAVREEG